MELESEERLSLGRQIRVRREAIFGTKSAAYTEAKVNSETWNRIESGEVVRDDRLRAAVRLLWPGSDGDWSRIPPDEPATETPGARVERLEDRVARLERIVRSAAQDRPEWLSLPEDVAWVLTLGSGDQAPVELPDPNERKADRR